MPTPATPQAAHKPGTPVPPLPTCDFPNIAAFQPGKWNGGEYGPDFVKQLLDNFKKFSAGPNPYHLAYVSINHDKFPLLANLRLGQLDNARIDTDGVLRMDAKGVPGEVGQWANTGLLRVPSIEFVRPEKDATGKIVGGFVGPDGKFVDGPVIKCVTFLGARDPGVNGIEPLPTAVFSKQAAAFASAFRGGVLLKFEGVRMQPRDQILSALQALGLDVTSFTADIPDQALQAILDFANACKAAGATGTGAAAAGTPAGDNAAGTVQQASGAATGVVGGGAPAAVNVPGVAGGLPGGGNPSQITLKFANGQTAVAIIEQPGATHANVTLPPIVAAQLAAATNIARQAQQTVDRFVNTGKATIVDQFFSRMSSEGRITDAQAVVLKPLLMTLDHVKTEKFASVAGAAFEGTALEAKMREIEASYVPQRKTGRNTPQNPIPRNGDATGGGQRTGGMSAERRARMLKGAGATGNRLVKHVDAAGAVVK